MPAAVAKVQHVIALVPGSLPACLLASPRVCYVDEKAWDFACNQTMPTRDFHQADVLMRRRRCECVRGWRGSGCEGTGIAGSAAAVALTACQRRSCSSTPAFGAGACSSDHLLLPGALSLRAAAALYCGRHSIKLWARRDSRGTRDNVLLAAPSAANRQPAQQC